MVSLDVVHKMKRDLSASNQVHKAKMGFPGLPSSLDPEGVA